MTALRELSLQLNFSHHLQLMINIFLLKVPLINDFNSEIILLFLDSPDIADLSIWSNGGLMKRGAAPAIV